MLERDFQKQLIKKIHSLFPGCIVMKTDPKYIQGLPDLLILFENKWAALEVKNSKKAHRQPNQDYYIKLMNRMSYASFISPENEKEILNEIQCAFKSKRPTRVPKSKSTIVVELRRRKVS